ncbi:O-antigen ligase family protein [Vibrio natriegens]|uniref:O-antigen ligase family protein n=1 Tax=Vibrio natriegens TaxID=691 RepID=UPI003B5CC20E
MLFGVSQVFSAPILFVSTLVIVLLYRNIGIVLKQYYLFLLFLTFFIIVGGSVSAVYNLGSGDVVISYMLKYVSSFLIIISVSLCVFYLLKYGRENQLVNTIYLLLFVSVASIFFSKSLNEIYVMKTMSIQRSSGFFGNPGEAAMICCLLISINLVYFSKYITLSVAILIFSLFGIILTYSKTGMLLSVVIIFLSITFPDKNIRKVSVISIFILVSLLASFATLSLMFELTASQISRLIQVKDILTGSSISFSELSTGRDVIWNSGFEKISNNLFFGGGIGSFHEGVYYGQGIHNLYIMILGESGVVTFILFLVFIVYTLINLIKCSFGRRSTKLGIMALLIFIVFLVDAVGTHNTLMLRYNNFSLGLVFGALAYLYDLNARDNYV